MPKIQKIPKLQKRNTEESIKMQTKYKINTNIQNNSKNIPIPMNTQNNTIKIPKIQQIMQRMQKILRNINNNTKNTLEYGKYHINTK